MAKRRSSEMIIESILQACSDGASKTKIIYQSNLNSTTVNPYLDLLIDNELIEADQTIGVGYKTTRKGYEFMMSLKLHNDAILKLDSLLAYSFMAFSLAYLWIFNDLLNLPCDMFFNNPPF
jgi:predicted transcriptional regulator